MVRGRAFLQLLLLTWLTSALRAAGGYERFVVTTPQDAMLEIGTNFTATCVLINTSEATADDLYWDNMSVPKEQYTRINDSALSVTISITSTTPEWLICKCKKPSSPFVTIYPGKFMHGIRMRKGYRPQKPENLSCTATQKGPLISPNISCKWEPGTLESKELPTKYTLSVKKKLASDTVTETTKRNNTGLVVLEIFPHHMDLDIWVKAENELGTVESDHLIEDANWFVKTNPPKNVKVISEKLFPTSLLINWGRPIAKEYVELIYQIRYCARGSQTWIDVPLVDTSKDIQSFRIQYLHPDTLYVSQLRCKHIERGHWSDWSVNATVRTPEDKPGTKPDLWRIITAADGNNKPQMELISKDPVLSNGKITQFHVEIQWSGREVHENVSVNSLETDDDMGHKKITSLKQINLPDKEAVRVEVIAYNSEGASPKALLMIPRRSDEFPPVENLTVWTQSGQLQLSWRPPNIPARTSATEYVVEWASAVQMDWQREHGNVTHSAIKGNLERYKCYNISVYPIYSGRIGKPATVKAFLEEGAPLEGPSVRVDGKPGRNEALLVWEEIPQDKRRGFIKNYTIFISSGGDLHLHPITVPANTSSYLLKSLSSDTKYDTWIRASTVKGSASGNNHTFSTLKYAPGEIEANVVGVCFGFLFIVLLAVILCICKRDSIKKNFWPQIPNPGNSSIGAWSPDYPSKAHTPKENTPAGVSVVEVDVFDDKSVFEEDKANSPLKKDKYLSEEHSSGIGGSSCMSSPRQSVSDSDEGGDIGETTASTVQYSSVVASSGYKGQTPICPPPQRQQATFSRSESTQPLLDSEENPESSGQEGSRQSQRFPRNPCFRDSAGNEDGPNSADFDQVEIVEQKGQESGSFCPLEEDSQQTPPTEDQSLHWLQEAAISSYMPQLGGYRQQ
ncbi:interleukin-6 receptor subunit beta [Genypterus blacodes]|uniref:interleukin-6 receptor subunit beta n=1 Tax=Genypterus blacodes TaxID=154954 RepID=UPI003F768039